MFDDEDDEVDNDGNWGNILIFDFKSGIISVVFDVDFYFVCFIFLCNNIKFSFVEFSCYMNCKNCGKNYS